MSESEKEELDSEEEDLDYVPEGGEDVDEASGESEKSEDEVDDIEGGKKFVAKPKKTTRSSKKNLKRGRTRRGVVYGDDSEESESIEVPSKKSKAEDELKDKKRVDDLWASFLSDVKTTKPKTSTQKVLVQKGTKIEVEGGDSSSSDFISSAASTSATAAAADTSSSKTPNSSSTTSQKITITKVFDFAGEEIKVTKEVSIDSEEAKEELARRRTQNPEKEAEKSTSDSNEKSERSSADDSNSAVSAAGAAVAAESNGSSGGVGEGTSTKKGDEGGASLNKKPPLATGNSTVDKILALGKIKSGTSSPGLPPKGGLSNIMNKIGGTKKKMSVLEKTSIDWKKFKEKEGIVEELSSFNKGKGGYLEKQKFLQQTDFRQYDLERNLRMGKR